MSEVVAGRGLVKSYQRGAEAVLALAGVDLVAARGQLVVVRGPSGSGKTTLLNLLCGWERADEGTVRWQEDEVDLAALPWAELAVVPQSLGLLDELSVRDNVSLPLRLGAPTPDWSAVDELLERFGLAHLAPRLPAEASLGEQQRAAVARALVSAPALVLADEPTAHQDRGWAAEVLGALRDRTREGAACIIASHDPDVMRAADAIVTLHDGVAV